MVIAVVVRSFAEPRAVRSTTTSAIGVSTAASAMRDGTPARQRISHQHQHLSRIQSLPAVIALAAAVSLLWYSPTGDTGGGRHLLASAAPTPVTAVRRGVVRSTRRRRVSRSRRPRRCKAANVAVFVVAFEEGQPFVWFVAAFDANGNAAGNDFVVNARIRP